MVHLMHVVADAGPADAGAPVWSGSLDAPSGMVTSNLAESVRSPVPASAAKPYMRTHDAAMCVDSLGKAAANQLDAVQCTLHERFVFATRVRQSHMPGRD